MESRAADTGPPVPGALTLDLVQGSPSAPVLVRRISRTRTKSQTTRALRLDTRERMRPLALPRVAACGRAAGEVVTLRRGQAGGGAGVSGLLVCGSVWCCPVCSARIAEARRSELGWLMMAHRERGGGFALLTLTMRHRRGQKLSELWDALSDAWRAAQQGRAVRRLLRQESLGCVRVVEVTHGRNGWHVHLHAVVFLKDAGHTASWFEAQESVLVSAWSSALARRGYSCVPEAQQFRRLTGDPSSALGEYFTKATLEVTRSDLKDGRYGNRTPWQILTGALDGLVDDVHLWMEWAQSSKGRRQFGWSKGLREALSAEVERSDQEIAEEETGGEDVVCIGREEWKRVRRRGLVPVLLDAIDLGACLEMSRALVVAVLDGLDIAWMLPEDFSYQSGSQTRGAA